MLSVAAYQAALKLAVDSLESARRPYLVGGVQTVGRVESFPAVACLCLGLGVLQQVAVPALKSVAALGVQSDCLLHLVGVLALLLVELVDDHVAGPPLQHKSDHREVRSKDAEGPHEQLGLFGGPLSAVESVSEGVGGGVVAAALALRAGGGVCLRGGPQLSGDVVRQSLLGPGDSGSFGKGL